MGDLEDCCKFPENFFDIGGKTFEWVFAHKKDWVSFTLTDMEKTSGFFKVWQDYVKRKTTSAAA